MCMQTYQVSVFVHADDWIFVHADLSCVVALCMVALCTETLPAWLHCCVVNFSVVRGCVVHTDLICVVALRTQT